MSAKRSYFKSTGEFVYFLFIQAAPPAIYFFQLVFMFSRDITCLFSGLTLLAIAISVVIALAKVRISIAVRSSLHFEGIIDAAQTEELWESRKKRLRVLIPLDVVGALLLYAAAWYISDQWLSCDVDPGFRR